MFLVSHIAIIVYNIYIFFSENINVVIMFRGQQNVIAHKSFPNMHTIYGVEMCKLKNMYSVLRETISRCAW